MKKTYPINIAAWRRKRIAKDIIGILIVVFVIACVIAGMVFAGYIGLKNAYERELEDCRMWSVGKLELSSWQEANCRKILLLF
jgi:CHASE3 domain sensor protein